MNDPMDDFVASAGWADAVRRQVASDWSPRLYWRLQKPDGRTAVLLKSPQQDIPGHTIPDFISLGERLRQQGLSAPEVYAADVVAKFALMEDFGDTPIDTPAIEMEAYEAAVDLLTLMRDFDTTGVKSYKDGEIFRKLTRFSPDPAWTQAWLGIEASLPPCPYVFAHMDYKAGNLHWLPQRTGVRRIGLLDFQGAETAPFTYDIANLLEDARRNLPPAMKAALKARFKSALPSALQEIFDDWYIFMAAQFHARVLGQIRGNTVVAADIAPRLRAYLREELQHPLLAPVLAQYAEEAEPTPISRAG